MLLGMLALLSYCSGPVVFGDAWCVDKINPLSPMIDGNSALPADLHFRHPLKKFPQSKY